MKADSSADRGRRRCWCRCRPTSPTPTRILPGMEVGPGSIVRVPLGPREVAGIVWDGDGGRRRSRRSCRPISQVFDCPPLDHDMRRFVDWVAAYTLSPPGMVARMLLRAPAAFDPEPLVEGLQLHGGEPDRMTTARARVLELAADGLGLDALRPRPCGRRFARPSSTGLRDARRVRAGDDPAAAGRRGARPGFRRSPSSTGPAARGGRCAARRASQPAASASRCSTASPARARPRSISRRSPRRSSAASRC